MKKKRVSDIFFTMMKNTRASMRDLDDALSRLSDSLDKFNSSCPESFYVTCTACGLSTITYNTDCECSCGAKYRKVKWPE